MIATSKPLPGTAAALVDLAARYITEGRYRMAHLHLVWHRERIDPDELAELVNEATAVPAIPAGLRAADVIDHGKPDQLPRWLDAPIDVEIARIFSRQPVAATGSAQLVARLAAAICVDVSVEIALAAGRVHEPDASSDAAAPTGRSIHLDAPDLIELDADETDQDHEVGARRSEQDQRTIN